MTYNVFGGTLNPTLLLYSGRLTIASVGQPRLAQTANKTPGPGLDQHNA